MIKATLDFKEWVSGCSAERDMTSASIVPKAG